MRSVCLVVVLVACRASATEPDEVAPDASEPDASVPLGDFCGATDPRTVAVEVVATPEAGEAPYTSVLATAETSIDLEVYLMGYGGILDLLEAKAGAGVTVRVMLDGGRKDTNQKYYDRLVAAGVQVKWSSPAFSHFHAKFFIVDGKAAVLSTGNFSKTYSIERERNFVATNRDPADLADLAALFEADWAGARLAMPCTRLVVSPINARDRLLDVIASAQQTLEIESMQFADREIREAVRDRALAGVAVRVLLADPGWIDANADGASYLASAGVPVKWIPHLHTKAMIADGKAAYVGSENLSYTSLDKNREVGLIVVEPTSVAPMSETFERDWITGTSF